MDEPTASLDGARRTELAATLKTLVTHGRSLVIATHDVDFARQCAQRVVMLAGGRIERDGPALEGAVTRGPVVDSLSRSSVSEGLVRVRM
jgi:energy-coupling factor transport system ATP-binding protein